MQGHCSANALCANFFENCYCNRVDPWLTLREFNAMIFRHEFFACMHQFSLANNVSILSMLASMRSFKSLTSLLATYEPS